MSRGAVSPVHVVPELTDVFRATVAHFRISAADLLGPKRDAELTVARHIAWYLEREKGLSYPAIGRLYNRDHTSILAATNHMRERVTVADARYMPALDAIRATLVSWAAGERHDPNAPCKACGVSVPALHREIAEAYRKAMSDFQKRLKELGVQF